MNQLQETLSRCSGDLLGFAIMFFIILCVAAASNLCSVPPAAGVRPLYSYSSTSCYEANDS